MTNQITSGAQSSAPSYQDVLGHRESSGNYDAVNQLGYLGKYQFGGMALQDLGYKNAKGQWTGKDGINSKEDFLASPQVQENAQTRLMNMQDRALNHYGATEFIGQEFAGVQVTPEGLRAAAHLVGPKAVSRMLKSGEVPQDANGTKATEYMKMFAPTPAPEAKPAPELEPQEALEQTTSGENTSVRPVVQEPVPESPLPRTESPTPVQRDRLDPMQFTAVGTNTSPIAPSLGQQKQEALTKRSEEKQLQLAGLTEQEQNILAGGISNYVSQGDTSNMAQRVSEFHAIEKKYNDIQAAKQEQQQQALFDDLQSPLQYAGNAVLSAANSALNIVGGIASAPASIRAAVNLADITEEDFASYQNILKKQAAQQELSVQEQKFMESAAWTDINDAVGAIDNAQSIQGAAGFLGDYVNTELTDEFIEEGTQVFKDLAEGKSSVLEFLGESVDLLMSNPGALGQATIESLPYVIASAMSLPLTVASSWSNNQIEALETYAAENEGQLPTGQELAQLTMLAGGQSLVDHFGDRLVGSAAFGKATGNIFKKAGTNAGNLVQGAAGEFVAEGGAEVLGQLAGQASISGDIDFAQSFAAGLLGAGAGGMTSAGGTAVGAVSSVVQGAKGAVDANKDKIKTVTQGVKEASGKVKGAAEEAYNRVKPTESEESAETPLQESAKAVQQEAPEVTAEDLNTAPEGETAEQRQQREEDAEARIDTEPMRKQVREAFESADSTKIAEAEAMYKDLKAKVTELVSNDPEGTSFTAQDFATIAAFTEVQAERTAAVTAYNEAKAKKTSKQAENLATASSSNKNTEAVKQNVLGSINTGNLNIPAKTVEGILNNPNLPFTAEERSAMEDYVEVAKGMEEVGKDVVEGGKGFLGVKQYAANAGIAITDGDLDAARKELEGLTNFRDRHLAKLQSGMHKGKPMTDRLKSRVANEVKLMIATVNKIEKDIQRAEANPDFVATTTPQIPEAVTQRTAAPETTAPMVAEQPAPQATPVAEDAPVAEAKQQVPTGPRYTMVEAANAVSDAVADQQITELEQAIQGTTTPEAQPEPENNFEQVRQNVKDKFAEANQDPALADRVLADLETNLEEGITLKKGIAELKKQYDADLIKSVEEDLKDLFDKSRQTVAYRMTKPTGPKKVPEQPQGVDLKTHLRSYNWINAYFEPRTDKSSILQTVRDLFDKPLASTFATFMGRDLTNAETQMAKIMESLHPRFVKTFNERFDRDEKKRQFKYKDPALYLADYADEKNVRDAIFVGIVNWLSTRGDDTRNNDKTRISKILGQDKKTELKKEAWELAELGVSYNAVADTLGKDILQQLNLTTTPEAFDYLQAKMETSLGMLALDIMQNMPTKNGKGLISVKPITEAELNNYRTTPKVFKDKKAGAKKYNYVRVTDQSAEGVKDFKRALDQANDSSPDETTMFEQIFGAVSKNRDPLFKQPKPIGTKVKNSSQKLSEAERAGLDKHQARKHYIRDDAYFAFYALGTGNMAKILGETDEDDVHVVNRKKQKSLNDTIAREIDQLINMVQRRDEEGGVDTPFYFEHAKWKTGRYGIDANTFNPQGTKLHRAFTAQEGWKGELNPQDKNVWFWSAMDEYLGAGSREKLLAKYGSTIEAMQYFLANNEWRPQDVDHVTTALLDTPAKAESFTALMQIAKHETALAEGTTFTTDLSVEIDGKTNGVILTMLQYGDGADAEELLAKLGKGGIYKQGTYDNFIDFKHDPNKKNLDAYEEIAGDWMKAVDKKFEDLEVDAKAVRGMKEIFNLIKVEISNDGEETIRENDKGSRKLAKNPLMVLNYGAGEDSVIGTVSQGFINQIYASIEADPLNYPAIAKTVNSIVPNALPETTGMPLEQTMTSQAEQKIRELIGNTFGASVVDVIGARYENTRTGQKSVNNILDSMFRMHTAVRETMVAQKIAELTEKGEFAQGISSLTTEQLKEIDNQLVGMLPQMKTYFSKKSGNPIQNMFLDKTERIEAEDDSKSRVEAKYGADSDTANGLINIRKPSAPGVGGGVTTIHSLDALIMFFAYANDIDVMGVHDAILVGFLNATEAGQQINRDTFKAMTEMDIPSDIMEAYAASKNMYLKFRAGQKDKAALDNRVNEAGGKKLKDGDVTGLRVLTKRENDLKNTIARVRKVKDELLKRDDLIFDQYASETGLSAAPINQAERTATTNTEVVTQLEQVIAPAQEQAKQQKQASRPKQAAKPANSLGSMNAAPNVSPSTQDADAVVDATNLLDVFDKLPTTGGKVENEAHKQVLRERVNHFGAYIMAPFKMFMETQDNAPNYGVMNNGDIYMYNMAEGTPVTSRILAMGVQMSPEEVMAHELNHLVYIEGLRKDSYQRRYLERIYKAAREQLTAADLVGPNATPSEIAGAQTTFEYMMYNTDGNALAEFAAFATTNENFMKALERVQVKETELFKGTVGEIIRKILNHFVDMISEKTLKLKGTPDQNILKLLDGMHKINAKKRNSIIEGYEKAAQLYSDAVAKGADFLKQQIKKGLDAKILSNFRPFGSSIPAAVEGLGRVADDPVAYRELQKGMDFVRDAIVGNRDNFLTQTFTEIIGRTDNNAAVRDLHRNANVRYDRERKAVKDAMYNHIKDSFGRQLSDEEWTALNKTLLKLDVSSLMGRGPAEVQQLLGDETYRAAEIRRLENMLSSSQYANFYNRSAKNLGYYMVTGKSNEKVALLNAHNIAKVFGDKSIKVSDVEVARVTPIIDTLATLHGIDELILAQELEGFVLTESGEIPPTFVDTVNALFEEEAARDVDNNGITTLLRAHNMLKAEARTHQFNSEAEANALTIKGWTKENYRQGTDIKFSTKDDRELLAQGYIMGEPLVNDPADPVREQRYIYVAPDGALSPYMSTIASLSSNIAKGSNREDVNRIWGADDPKQAAKVDVIAINRKRQADIREMINSPKVPNNAGKNFMIPIVNPKGEFVDWRYMMSEDLKDNQLGKDNNAADVIGSMAGNVVDKRESKKVNEDMIDNAYSTWLEQKDRRAKAFVEISNESPNARHREIWRQLPEEARKYAISKFGGPKIMMRADLVVANFGYRKFSLAEVFQKDPETRKWWEAMVAGLLTPLMVTKDPHVAARRIAKAENIMISLTQEVKDVVVVKSGIVTIANMLSNTMLLAMNGMSPLKAIQKQYEAYRNSTDMLKDMRRVRELELKAQTQDVNQQELNRITAEMARLRNRIADNPTKEAYDAGLMPTIVDDAAADLEFQNTIRGDLQRKVSKGIDKYLGRTPSWVREAAKFAAGTSDSQAYQFMNNLVMQSDFMARYAILEHMKEDQGITSASEKFNDLVGEAEELFVNFNAPTHRGIQYLNDIGLTWFTKYALRINRTIARTFIKNPINAVMTTLGVETSFLDSMIDNPAVSSVLGGGDPMRVIGDPLSRAIDATELSVAGQLVGLMV